MSSTSPAPLRPTRQRRAVSEALAAGEDFRSAQDIHDAIRHAGEKVGLATVYRALQTMADAGEVDVRQTGTGETVYRRCSPTHHHHLVCRVCGRTVEITGSAVETWAARTAAEHGFADVDHTVELSGVCADCHARS